MKIYICTSIIIEINDHDSNHYLLIKIDYLNKILQYQLRIKISPSVYIFWTKIITMERYLFPSPNENAHVMEH